MTEQEIIAANCIEMALESKMTRCMEQIDWWRHNKPVSGDEEWRRVNVRYWQGRLKDYFLAAVVANDACVTIYTPEDMMRNAALNFAYIKGVKKDA